MHIRVVETVHEGFAGLLEEAMASASMTPRLSDDLLVPALFDDASFDPAQGLSPDETMTTLATIGKKPTDPPTVTLVHRLHGVELGAHRSTFLAPKVVHMRLTAEKLTST
jgi:hypothetical protein